MFFLPSSYLSGETSREREHIHGEFITNTRQPGMEVKVRVRHVIFWHINGRADKES